jgi:hypothetical protein
MDKFALEGKVKDLESKIKEQTKKIADLTEASNSSKQVKFESFWSKRIIQRRAVILSKIEFRNFL